MARKGREVVLGFMAASRQRPDMIHGVSSGTAIHARPGGEDFPVDRAWYWPGHFSGEFPGPPGMPVRECLAPAHLAFKGAPPGKSCRM